MRLRAKRLRNLRGAKSFSSECSLSRELPRENYAHFTPFNFLGAKSLNNIVYINTRD